MRELQMPELTDQERQEMIVRICNLSGLSQVETFQRLPENIKELWSDFADYAILRSIVRHERRGRGLSYNQLSIKYNLTVRQVCYLITSK